MDYRHVLDELEQACADFQAPATRVAAERQLVQFGKRADAIAAGKYALAHSGVPTAKFFALRGIKEAVVAGYAVLGPGNAIALRDELLQLALASGRSLDSFVLDSLCWVVAVITKRAWADTPDEQRRTFTRALCADIVHHNTPCIGMIVASHLIDEVSGGSRCSEFHLPWEFHYACKAGFENAHMPLLFEAALKVVHRQLQQSLEAQRAPPTSCRAIAYERRSALHIVDRALGWEFTSPEESKVIAASFGYSKGGAIAGGVGGRGPKAAPCGSDLDDADDTGSAIFDPEYRSRTPLFPRDWQPLLLSSDVLSMLFFAYEAALGDQMHAHFSPGSSHIALQCLIQISGIRGKAIFSPTGAKDSDTLRAEFAQVIMRNQLQMIRHVCSMDLAAEASEDMVVATTQMIRRFIETQLEERPAALAAGRQLHPLAFLVARVPETLEYFGEVSKLICMLLGAAAGVLRSDILQRIDDDFGDVDSYFVMQAFDELASAWSAVISDIREWQYLDEVAAAAVGAPQKQQSPDSTTGGADCRYVLDSFTRFLKTTACLIRSEYIQLRMLMCEVSVGAGAGDMQNEVLSAGHGLLAKDYVVYEDQLQFFALLARLDTRASLDRLYENLCSRCHALQREFSTTESDADDEPGAGYNQHTVDLLHEQAQWTVLMIAHALCDSGTSERVLIPRPILDCSSASSGLEHDLAVQCIVSMLKALEFELASPQSASAAYGSPLFVETLFWALRRIAPVYFLLDCSDYSAPSPSIVAAFGRVEDGGRGPDIVNGLLDLVQRAFDLWSSEEDVLQMCTSMLLALAQRPPVARQITSSPLFAPLMLYLTGNMGRFPEAVHGSIIEALALLACHSPPAEHEKSFSELKQLVLRGFGQATQSEDLAAPSQDARAVVQLLDGLDMMDGLLSAANFQNMSAMFALFFELHPLLERLLGMYAGGHEVTRNAIQVMESAARYLDVSSLPDDECMLRLSRCFRGLLQKYHSTNQGRIVSQVGADVGSLGETTALISTISYLVCNEMGFSPNEAHCSASRPVADDFGETEAFGVYCIHALTEPAQLVVPNVLRMHMQLLSEMVQYRTPSLMRWLPAKVWAGIMDVLLAGIDNDIYDVGQRTYEIINKLGAYVKLNGIDSAAGELRDVFGRGFRLLLAKLLRTLLFSPFDVELVESAGAALVTLALAEPEHLQSCFQGLVSQSQTEALAERLSSTLAKFNADLGSCDAVVGFLQMAGPIPDPIDSAALRQPLFEFLVNARAVLRVR
ncbi:hypothetical protein LPJ61_000861 [Coemansia biformis]|uniref:Exportin-4 n=1 Tax=Coemansia biformis TaxID=1286918 RepID=A0A9W8D049_9FUNG|nr:hypothetical protein LPJ61_000861 [Coemansia biformis]